MRLAANVGQRRLRRLLHYVAQLPGDGELALAVEHLHFCGQNAAADFGPRQAGDQPDFALFMRLGVAVLGDAEKVGDVRRADLFLVLGSRLHYLARHLAAHVADLAFQVADSGFARVVANDFQNRIVLEDDIFLAQAGLLALLLDEILTRDFQLFLLRVALQAKDLHAVLERCRNGVHYIGRGHEQHLREIVVHVEVVILEGHVLLGVEHFKQRRCRVAAKVRRNLVYLIQQEHGILRPGALHVLDDLAGHGADVGAPMAANLGLVVHSAQ